MRTIGILNVLLLRVLRTIIDIYILYNLYFLMYPKTWQQIASCPRRSFIKETRMGNSITLSFYTSLSYVVSIPASFIRLSSIFYFLTSFNLIVLYRRNRDPVKFTYTYIIYCLTINSSPLFRWGTTEQKFWSSVFFCFLYNLTGLAKLILSKTTGW